MQRKFLKGSLLGTLILSSSWTIASCENTPINNNENNDDDDEPSTIYFDDVTISPMEN